MNTPKEQTPMMQMREDYLELLNDPTHWDESDHSKGYKAAIENVVKDIEAQRLPLERKNGEDIWNTACLTTLEKGLIPEAWGVVQTEVEKVKTDYFTNKYNV